MSDDAVPGDVESFFAGVAEMRAYLDRHIQDPDRQRARLSRIARDLLKPRGTRVLINWLARHIREALGADACGIWIDENGWGEWVRAGSEGDGPTLELLESLDSDEIVGTPAAGMTVPIPGIARPVGALWISGTVELADESRDLIQAIAGATGMVIDQAIKAAAVARDPVTGLLPTAQLVQQAQTELRHAPPGASAHAMVGLRSEGVKPGEVASLAHAARMTFPPGTLLGSRPAAGGTATDLFAIPPLVSTTTCHVDIPEYVATIAATLATEAWVGAYWIGDAPVEAVAPILDRMSSEMDNAEPMEICQLGSRLDSVHSRR